MGASLNALNHFLPIALKKGRITIGNMQIDTNLQAFLSFCQNIDVPIIASEVDATKRDWLLKNGCTFFVKNDVWTGNAAL